MAAVGFCGGAAFSGSGISHAAECCCVCMCALAVACSCASTPLHVVHGILDTAAAVHVDVEAVQVVDCGSNIFL
jgi:hypothetical protein